MFTGFYSTIYNRLAEQPQTPLSLADLLDLQQDVPEAEKHWEFVAIALLHAHGWGQPTYAQAPIDREVLTGLLARCVKNHHAGNWRLMRVILQAALDNAPCLTRAHVTAADVRVFPSGYLEDLPGVESTQYHAYLLHLMMRFGSPDDEALRPLVQAALRWLMQCDQEDGDPNARGRGQFQLFGYVSMAYCAEHAAQWGAVVGEDWHLRVLQRVRYHGASGALSLFWESPLRSEWLLGYNTPDDYPAFARFWLGTQMDATVASGAPVLRAYRSEAGHLVLADNTQGPVLVITPALPVSGQPLGIRAALSNWWTTTRTLGNRLLKRAAPIVAETAPAERRTHQTRSWRVDLLEDGIQLTPANHAAHEVMETVWVAPGWTWAECDNTLAGAVELEQLQWVKRSQWAGLAIRRLRDAPIRLHLQKRGF